MSDSKRVLKVPDEQFLPMLHEQWSKEYDQMCQDRHDMGKEKYGPVKFLEVDSIEMALEEITDMSNYLRYTFIKLKQLQFAIASMVPAELDEPVVLGKGSVVNPYKKD